MAVKLMKFPFNLLSLHDLQPPWVNNTESQGNVPAINTLGVLLNNASRVPHFIWKNTFFKTHLEIKTRSPGLSFQRSQMPAVPLGSQP